MIELSLTPGQAAPLLLEQQAQMLRDRSHTVRSVFDCWTLLDAYIGAALDDAAADGGSSWGHPRQGQELALGAAVYTRKLARAGVDRVGELQSARIRLRHFGAPSTWHLRLIAEQARLLGATLDVGIDEAFPLSRLADLHCAFPGGELLKLAGAAGAGSSTPGDLAGALGRALFAPEWMDVIQGGREGAKKARAYARQKARAALAAGRRPELATSSLSAAGNALLAEVLDTGMEVWRCHGVPFTDTLTATQAVSVLGYLAEERCRPQIVTWLGERAKQESRRSRLSPLAARSTSPLAGRAPVLARLAA